jgi:ATP adenylyltransferase
MPIERMWAGWRNAYVTDTARVTKPAEDQTLFEAILDSGMSDDETYIVSRGATCFTILNRYPYSSGHLLVLPLRGVADLDDLTADEFTELWATVSTAVRVVKDVYSPDGVNIGLNMGKGAGAGVPDHLHVHVLPRWLGDTNFTVAIAETKVLAEALDVTYERLFTAWPSPSED